MNKRKIGIGVLALVAIGLAAAGAAKAADVDDGGDDDDGGGDGPCPEGQVRVPGVPGPNGQTTWICVPTQGPVEPAEDPPAKPSAGHAKNYVGSGYNWPRKDRFPNERSFGLALQQLGYPTNPAAANWSVLSAAFMTIVRDFQRDWNDARTHQTVDLPPPPALDDDGLIGKNTINAIIAAQRWVIELALPWATIVET